MNPAYRDGKRSARKSHQLATGVAPRVPLHVFFPEDLNFQSVPAVKFFLPGRLSFFVKKSSALQRRGSGSSAPRRSIKHLGVNGKWPGRRGERSGVRLQRRGARLGLPRRAAQPAALTRPARPPHPRRREAPPRARPRDGGRAAASAVGERPRGRGGARPRPPCPEMQECAAAGGGTRSPRLLPSRSAAE